MYIVPINDDKFVQIIKIIKLGKNLGRNEKTHIGHWNYYIGISSLVFNPQRRNSEAREPTIKLKKISWEIFLWNINFTGNHHKIHGNILAK